MSKPILRQGPSYESRFAYTLPTLSAITKHTRKVEMWRLRLVVMVVSNFSLVFLELFFWVPKVHVSKGSLLAKSNLKGIGRHILSYHIGIHSVMPTKLPSYPAHFVERR